MAEAATFDLRTQPWLLVRTLSGTTEEVSVVDAVARARELQGLAGEVPTQAFALYRLLLALLHRAVPWDREDPLAQWADAWAGELDVAGHVRAHLDAHADRFDLLHPATPFYQVAGLRTAKGGASPLTSLVADVPNGHQYFTTRAGRSLERIGLAEAARWLVHAHAFDPAGIRSGVVGDPRAKGGPRSFPIGTGWAGRLGGVLVEGRDLLETLLLNLVLLDRDGQPWPESDTAVWERLPQGPGVEAEGRVPTGPADLLTWQSRRARLVVTGGLVTGVVLSNGDPLRPQNQHPLETMTGWRRSQTQEKALKQPLVYMPRTHEPSRAMWRGLPALLPHAEGGGSRGEVSEGLPPGVLRWVSRLVGEGELPGGYRARTRAVGIAYGSNESVIDEVVDDALVLHAVLLGERGGQLRQVAIEAVGVTDEAALALANLASNLAAAAGGEVDAPRHRAREQAYFALDAPYRAWLTSLLSDVDAQERRTLWEQHVFQVVRDLGAELITTAGVLAWVGREVRGRAGSRYLDAATAEAQFVVSLRKALVLAAPPDRSNPSTERTDS